MTGSTGRETRDVTPNRGGARSRAAVLDAAERLIAEHGPTCSSRAPHARRPIDRLGAAAPDSGRQLPMDGVPVLLDEQLPASSVGSSCSSRFPRYEAPAPAVARRR